MRDGWPDAFVEPPLRLSKFWINLLSPAPWANLACIDFALEAMVAQDGHLILVQDMPDSIAMQAIRFHGYPPYTITPDAFSHLSLLSLCICDLSSTSVLYHFI